MFLGGNINMNGNIYLNKENKNLNDGFIKVLFYNKLSQTIDIGSLKYTSPYKTEIGFKNNDSLTLEPIDNKTNLIYLKFSDLIHHIVIH